MNLENRSNEKLILMLQQGGNRKEILSIIYDKNYLNLEKFLIKKTNSFYEAENLAQETFRKAFEKIDQYNPKNKFTHWLFTIARNNFIDFYRDMKEERSFIHSQKKETKEPLLEPSSEDLIIEKEKYLELEQAIESLALKYHELIISKYYENSSIKEMAKKFNLPEGTIKGRLSRARESLKQKLRPNFYKEFISH